MRFVPFLLSVLFFFVPRLARADDRSHAYVSVSGFVGPRVIWPAGKEMVIADQFEGQPFVRTNDVTSNRSGGVYFSDLPPAGPLP